MRIFAVENIVSSNRWKHPIASATVQIFMLIFLNLLVLVSNFRNFLVHKICVVDALIFDIHGRLETIVLYHGPINNFVDFYHFVESKTCLGNVLLDNVVNSDLVNMLCVISDRRVNFFSLFALSHNDIHSQF